MIGYLVQTYNKLKNEKRGIEANPTLWQNQPYTAASLGDEIFMYSC